MGSIKRFFRFLKLPFGGAAVAFVGFFLVGSLLEGELPAMEELPAFLLFPVGYLTGMVVGFLHPKTGGSLAMVSIAMLFLLMPNAMEGPWFWVLFAAGGLTLLSGLIGKGKPQII